jgi:hypothetical protein
MGNISGCKRKKYKKSTEKIRNKLLRRPYSTKNCHINCIKTIRWTELVARTGEIQNAQKVLVRKSQMKMPQEIQCKLQDNIKIDITDTDCEV